MVILDSWQLKKKLLSWLSYTFTIAKDEIICASQTTSYTQYDGPSHSLGAHLSSEHVPSSAGESRPSSPFDRMAAWWLGMNLGFIPSNMNGWKSIVWFIGGQELALRACR